LTVRRVAQPPLRHIVSLLEALLVHRYSAIGRIVAVSTRHPAIVVLVAALLTAGAGMYAVRHFTMTANTEDLISPRLEWCQCDLKFQAAFPQLGSLTMPTLPLQITAWRGLPVP
jgi:hypothetical protein